MKTVKIATLVTAAMMLSAPAFSQVTADPAAPAATTSAPVPAPEGYSPVPDFAALTADQLTGIALHGPDNTDIGKVTDVELGADGAASGLIADIGGFLGMGSHTVRLGFDQVGVFSNADGRLIALTSLSEDTLKALPAYEKPVQ